MSWASCIPLASATDLAQKFDLKSSADGAVHRYLTELEKDKAAIVEGWAQPFKAVPKNFGM